MSITGFVLCDTDIIEMNRRLLFSVEKLYWKYISCGILNGKVKWDRNSRNKKLDLEWNETALAA